MKRRAAAAAVPVLAALLLARPAAAQLRRDPVVPDAAGVRGGELLLGAGLGYDLDGSYPLSGLRGNLLRLGTVTVAYAFADGAIVEVRGDAYHILRIRSRGTSHVPLDPGVADGTTGDAGDFTISSVVRLFGGRRGPAAGIDVGVKLPNSKQTRGIGLNTTDFLGNVFGSWGSDRLRASGEVGIGILTAPLRLFVQDDVLLYAAEVVWSPDGPGGTAPRLSLGFSGRANTRNSVPIGLEDMGSVRAGADWSRGAWALDASVAVGYAADSPDAGFTLGVARRFRL